MYLRLWPTRYVFALSRQSPRETQRRRDWETGEPYCPRWEMDWLGWRLFRIVEFCPLCQEPGCRERAITCWHWLCAERAYYCPDHAEQHGFCINCGQFLRYYESALDPRICRDCQYEEMPCL